MRLDSKPLTVADLLRHKRVEALGLQVFAGTDGLNLEVSSPRVQKPGLALAGYLPYVRPGRVQVIGASEAEYLATLPPGEVEERVRRLVELRPPLFIVAKGLDDAVRLFAPSCERCGVPLAVTAVGTSEVIERLSACLEILLAPHETRHGDLLDIFAIGVLLLGDSGLGKSECALELVHRGHRLVADDLVNVYRLRNEELVGQAPERLRGFIEVRGLGIISIEQLFGVVAVRDDKPIDLVIQFVPESAGNPERLGLDQSSITLVGVSRPLCRLPVAPGRNLALLVECAARKHLLEHRGVRDAAVDFLLRRDRMLGAL